MCKQDPGLFSTTLALSPQNSSNITEMSGMICCGFLFISVFLSFANPILLCMFIWSERDLWPWGLLLNLTITSSHTPLRRRFSFRLSCMDITLFVSILDHLQLGNVWVTTRKGASLRHSIVFYTNTRWHTFAKHCSCSKIDVKDFVTAVTLNF